MSIPQTGGGPIEHSDQLAEYLAAGCKPRDDWRIGTVDFEGTPVKIRTIPNHIYNSVLNHEYDGGDLNSVKVLHLSGVAQNQELFERFIAIVEDTLEQRGARP